MRGQRSKYNFHASNIMIAIYRHTMFGIAIFLSLITVTPVCIFRPFSSKNSRMFFAAFNFFGPFLARIEVDSCGMDKVLNLRPSVLVGNHQHNIDALAVAQIYSPYTVVLGKFQLGLIPYFGQIYVLAGNILVKRGNRKQSMASMKMIEKKVKSKKLTIMVFPEGTRNPHKELMPFKKGAFYTAVKTGSPILSFAVSQYRLYQDFGSWKPVKIYTRVLEPISTEGKSTKDIPELMAQTRSAIENAITELNKRYQKI